MNKNPAPATTALYPNDLVETDRVAVARIESAGSAADINPGTMVQFQNEELVLDHGSLSVNTSRGLRVRIGCLTVAPVNGSQLTHYEVTDVDGKVTVSARKSDVYIDAKSSNLREAKQSEKSSRTIVHETEQKSRDEKCGAGELRHAGTVAPILNSPWAIGAGAAAIAGVTCFALCQGSPPLSPSDP